MMGINISGTPGIDVIAQFEAAPFNSACSIGKKTTKATVLHGLVLEKKQKKEKEKEKEKKFNCYLITCLREVPFSALILFLLS